MICYVRALMFWIRLSPSLCVGATSSATPTPVTFIPPTPIPFAARDTSDRVVDRAASLVSDGSLKSADAARILVAQLATTIHSTDPNCDSKKSSFLINVVLFANSSTVQMADATPAGFGVGVVQSSNWYVYEPKHQSFAPASSGQTARIYGATDPYLLVIHLNSDITAYRMAYEATVNHRTAANLQDLEDAITLYKALVKPAAAPPAPGGPPPQPKDFWTWGQLPINTPASVTVTAGIAKPGVGQLSTKDITALEKTPGHFDDEGFYHWDVSVGIPITSYTQLQNVVPQSGATPSVPANIDRRNLLAIADVYIKPMDLKGTKFTYVPYVVGGISFASQPLHAVMAGVGFGPTTAGLYIGTMIVTGNLPNNIKATHVKIAFGMNFPIRAIISKLGVNTQVSSGASSK